MSIESTKPTTGKDKLGRGVVMWSSPMPPKVLLCTKGWSTLSLFNLANTQILIIYETC